MRRSRIISTAILMSLIGAVAPLVLGWTIAWDRAIEKEQDDLKPFAQRAVYRASGMFVSATAALAELEAMTSARCSQAHIARMRVLTVNIPSVEEIDYFEKGALKCTTWGMSETPLSKPKADYTTLDGMEVSLRAKASAANGRLMTSISLGDHRALVLPLRFVDVVLEEGMSLTVMTDNADVLNHLGPPNLSVAGSLIDRADEGAIEDYIYVLARRDGLIAAITVPTEGIIAELHREQMFFLPIGAFIAAFIVGLVIWFSRRRLSPLAELEMAVRKREFIVHYQPIIDIETRICVGAEALVRWRTPDGQLVRPDLFIPLAEESGLIQPITDQVVDQVISDLRALLVDDRSMHIAINLSASDIASGRALDVIDAKLQPTGIHAQQIWLEATERGFMRIDEARATLQKARDRGYSVSIDDFGTGYSSLQYLQGLPIDALKIDKSFVDTIGTASATSAVISHIIDMARELGLNTVAEGVETEAQLEYLKAHKVNLGQGWLFARPLPARDFIVFCNTRQASA